MQNGDRTCCLIWNDIVERDSYNLILASKTKSLRLRLTSYFDVLFFHRNFILVFMEVLDAE